MIRVTRGNIAQKRHKKILKFAHGFFGTHSKLFRIANSKILKAFSNSYIGRKQKKRHFRKLWITKLKSGTNSINLIKYSKLIFLLNSNKIKLNRKMLVYFMMFDPKFLILLIKKLEFRQENKKN